MPSTVAQDSNQVLLEIHDLLRDLDPARWRDEVEAKMRARLVRAQDQVSQLCAAFSRSDHGFAAARDRMMDLARVLRENAPRRKLPSQQAIRDEWMAFRARATPAYEAVVAALRSHSIVLPSVRTTNYARSFFHLTSATASILLLEVLLPMWFLPWLTGFLALVCWTLELTRRQSESWNETLMQVRFFKLIVHPRERHHVNSSTWYVTAIFLLSLAQSHVLGAIGLAVLGLADPLAALIGRRWGSIRLVNGRSLQGSLTFVAAGTLASVIVMTLAHPEIVWPVSLLMGMGAALLAGLAELFSRRLDDNLTIPLSAAAGAWAVALLTNAPL